MRRCIITTTLCLIATVAGAQTNAESGAPERPKGVQPLAVTLPELRLLGTTPVMFATLVREGGLSGGVAVSNPSCSHGPDGSISIPAGTSFNSALGQIAKAETASEWQVRDGIANLLPAGAAPSLLLVQIRTFEWDTNAPVGEVIDRLRHLPEVSGGALELGLKEVPFEGGMRAICIRGDCSEKPKRELALKTEEAVSLLTVLNRVVRAHIGAVWGYSEYRCDNGTVFSLEALAE
jgi:hypothetical protein